MVNGVHVPYRPNINPDHWAAIREFVQATVDDVRPHVPYQPPALYQAVTEFSLWAWQDAGLPLDISELFDRNVISYYTQVGCGRLTAAARGNRRSLLLRMAEYFDGASLRLPPLPPSDPSAPYDGREIVSIISWARAQSTSDRRENAHLLISLGFGAGLAAGEIISLRTRDIHREGRDLDVIVRQGRERRVPMLSDYVEFFPPREHNHPDAFVFRPGRTQSYVNAISNFVKRGQGGGLRPRSQRMRATWLVRHLDARTPLSVLTTAAGLDSLDALARFEQFIAPVPPDEATRALRYAPASRQ